MNKIDLPLSTQAKRLRLVTQRSAGGVSVAARQKITANQKTTTDENKETPNGKTSRMFQKIITS